MLRFLANPPYGNLFMKAVFRLIIVLSFLLILSAAAQEDELPHPLAIHMNQWLEGSREWVTPNPSYDPDDAASFTEFRVRWDWGPFKQQLLGKLFGVRDDGSTMLFWNLYATYNPVTDTVVYQQVGRGGGYIHGEAPARTQPLGLGEIERLDAMLYARNGSAKMTRHENTFATQSHNANVYERGVDGAWELKRQWHWKRVEESDVLGNSL